MSSPKITIYSTKTCAYCHMLKDYLDKNEVVYDVKLADENPAIAQELFEKSGQLGVPFTIIEKDNGEKLQILGFDKPQVDHALNLAK